MCNRRRKTKDSNSEICFFPNKIFQTKLHKYSFRKLQFFLKVRKLFIVLIDSSYRIWNNEHHLHLNFLYFCVIRLMTPKAFPKSFPSLSTNNVRGLNNVFKR